MLSDGTGALISMVLNSFRDLLVSPMYSAVQLLAEHFQWWIISVFCASGMGSFGYMSKDLMVLVPLKKTLTLYFVRVCLYCSLRPLVYAMTTLAPSINFTVDGFVFWWFSIGVCLVKRTVLGSGCLVGLCEGDPFLCKEFRCRTYLFSSVDEGADNR